MFADYLGGTLAPLGLGAAALTLNSSSSLASSGSRSTSVAAGVGSSSTGAMTTSHGRLLIQVWWRLEVGFGSWFCLV